MLASYQRRFSSSVDSPSWTINLPLEHRGYYLAIKDDIVRKTLSQQEIATVTDNQRGSVARFSFCVFICNPLKAIADRFR